VSDVENVSFSGQAKTEGEESAIDELRRVTRPIVIDMAVFLVILIALLGGYAGLHALQRLGYDEGRIRTFETLHYWLYSSLYSVFGVDLLFKVVLALFFRKKVSPLK
jgi:hypothetical protein